MNSKKKDRKRVSLGRRSQAELDSLVTAAKDGKRGSIAAQGQSRRSSARSSLLPSWTSSSSTQEDVDDDDDDDTPQPPMSKGREKRGSLLQSFTGAFSSAMSALASTDGLGDGEDAEGSSISAAPSPPVAPSAPAVPPGQSQRPSITRKPSLLPGGLLAVPSNGTDLSKRRSVIGRSPVASVERHDSTGTARTAAGGGPRRGTGTNGTRGAIGGPERRRVSFLDSGRGQGRSAQSALAQAAAEAMAASAADAVGDNLRGTVVHAAELDDVVTFESSPVDLDGEGGSGWNDGDMDDVASRISKRKAI